MLLFARAVHGQTTSEAFESGLRPAVRAIDDPPVRWTLEERMAHHGVPGVSVALIKGGEIRLAKGYGVRASGGSERVDPQTVFSVGSLSKTAAALTALRLVGDGRIDLDTEVNRYLRSWRVPPAEVANGKPVTLRGLLSHSAGISVHGFADYLPQERIPSLLQILDGSGPAKNAPIRVISEPGATSRYSGGGTTVASLVIADVTNMTFEAAAEQLLFAPLGLSRSTYENPLPASFGNIANAHDRHGSPTALPRGWHTFAETAASGLWTTPSDYARLLLALSDSTVAAEGGFLPPALARDALTEVGPSPHGLGPRLEGAGRDRRMVHSGANDAYKAWYEVYPNRGEGVVIFTNGANGRALYKELLRAIADQFGWPSHREVLVDDRTLAREQLVAIAAEYDAISPEDDADWRGRFNAPEPFRLFVKGNALYMGEESFRVGLLRAERDPVRLHAVDEQTLVDEGGEYRLQIVQNAEGRDTGVHVWTAGQRARYARVKRWSVTLPIG
ncbi:MAG: serine hydrolase domain-containing protein [Pseudomonadota bacterium]